MRGATSSALTQGIGVATGLQDKFSFAGVAGAAVGSSLASGISGIGDVNDVLRGGGPAAFATELGINTAAGIANAATRSALTGNSFGDELQAAIPDIIGQTVGGAIGRQASRAIAEANSDPVQTTSRGSAGTGMSGATSVNDRLRNTGSELQSLPPLPDDARVLDTVVVTPNGSTDNGISTLEFHEQGLNFVLQALSGLRQTSSFSSRGGRARRISLRRQAEQQFAAGIAQGERDFARQQRRLLNPFQTRDVIDSSDFLTLETRERNLANTLDFDLRVIQARVKSNDTAQFAADAAAAPLEFTGLGSLGAIAADYITTGEVSPFVALEALPILGKVPGVRGIAEAAGRGVNALITPAAKQADDVATRLFGGACFVAGTMIHTQNGLKPIEAIGIGDMVWSRSEYDQGEYGWRRVNDTFQFGDKAIWQVEIETPTGSRETYRATGNHPFWTENEDGGSWLAAELLEPGNTLRLADGSPATVIRAELTDDIEPVYNFEVDGWHTYFIGKLGTWVHNTNCREEAFALAAERVGFNPSDVRFIDGIAEIYIIYTDQPLKAADVRIGQAGENAVRT